jgi:nucleoside-diphosphate-sugar epimerase
MQTILGSGGAIGTHLARVLPKYTDRIRLVSRHPVKVNANDELYEADLLDGKAVIDAVKGSKIVYLTVGLTYKASVWEKDWPQLVDHVIHACERHKARLVFFDNIYMYTPDLPVPITEDTPIDPVTRKGRVRAIIAKKILTAHKEERIQAVIARAADFYGPGATQVSMLDQTVLMNLSKGKKANWLGSLDKKHSFTYTPDAAIATALLGNSSEAYGRVWHLPTAKNPPTGREWVSMAAEFMEKPARAQAVPAWMVTILGLFIPIMRELKEMLYQYDRDYVFDSSAFEKKFMMTPTPYKEGLKKVITKDYTPS